MNIKLVSIAIILIILFLLFTPIPFFSDGVCYCSYPKICIERCDILKYRKKGLHVTKPIIIRVIDKFILNKTQKDIHSFDYLICKLQFKNFMPREPISGTEYICL